MVHGFEKLYTLKSETQNISAIIFYDKEQTDSRYVVLFFLGIEHLIKEDYHTDDLVDAWETAQLKLIKRDEAGNVVEAA